MNRTRHLAKLVQEQSKMLFNQEKENAWHCRLIRANALAGQYFQIAAPEWHDEAFLITAKDLGKHRSVKLFRDTVPMLADKVVDYQGQVLALVLAPDTEQLQRCEQQVQISYGPSAPTPPDTGELWHCRRIIRSGEVVEALGTGLQSISTHQTWKQREYHHYEPRGVIAEWKSDMLWVQCSSSWPHLVRRLISESTGLPQKNITVISQPSGNLPDRFLVDSTFLACYASMAALTCMKQVQLFLSAIEDRRFGTRMAPISANLTSLHEPDGRMHSLKALVEIDSGVWPLGSQETMQTCLAGLCSNYRIPNQEIEVRLVKSEEAPAFLGENFGLARMQQILDHHIASVCDRLGYDQADFRAYHLLSRNDPTPYGSNLDNLQPAHQVLEHISRVSDFARTHCATEQLRHRDPQHPKRRGSGLALAYQSHGMLTGVELLNRPKIRLRLQADHHLVIHCPMHATNSTLKESWTDELQGLLGIDEKQISFCRFSTDQLDDSGPIRFSRLTSLYSPLLAAAAKLLKQRMAKSAGEIDIKLSMPNVRRIKWEEDNFSGTPFLGRSWAAAVLTLQIDQVQALAVVDRVWITISAGAVLAAHRATQVIQQAIRECLVTQGAIASPRLEIQVEFLGHERYLATDQQLLHAGGIGELVAGTIPAAFANALAQALGHVSLDQPATAESISLHLAQASGDISAAREETVDTELEELLL